MDVEGAEPEALRGMRETLRRSPGATLFLEWNPSALQHAGEDPLGLPDLLRSLGARPVAAFDEWNVTELSVEQVRAGLTDGSLPMDWAWNIKAVVGS
jgi:hypothetical protein